MTWEDPRPMSNRLNMDISEEREYENRVMSEYL
jgi:hypothetical protein